MVLREYSEFSSAISDDTHQYEYPPSLLSKAFEHLCARGLVAADTDGTHHRHAYSKEHTPLRLCINPNLIKSFVQHSATCPMQVKRFGGHDVL